MEKDLAIVQNSPTCTLGKVKDVRANCFCASLVRTKFTCHDVMHRARALSSKVNNNRENGHSCVDLTILDVQ